LRDVSDKHKTETNYRAIIYTAYGSLPATTVPDPLVGQHEPFFCKPTIPGDRTDFFLSRWIISDAGESGSGAMKQCIRTVTGILRIVPSHPLFEMNDLHRAEICRFGRAGSEIVRDIPLRYVAADPEFFADPAP
jgi:hypothetical protein